VSRYIESQERQDARAALICAVIANANRNPKKRPRPFRISDFMPRKVRQSADDMLVIAEAVIQAFGGEDQRGQQVRQKHMPEQLRRVLEQVNGK